MTNRVSQCHTQTSHEAIVKKDGVRIYNKSEQGFVYMVEFNPAGQVLAPRARGSRNTEAPLPM